MIKQEIGIETIKNIKEKRKKMKERDKNEYK